MWKVAYGVMWNELNMKQLTNILLETCGIEITGVTAYS